MRTARGFSLLELLVALAMLGLLAALSWTGFSQLTRSAAQREEVAARLTAVQRTIQTLTRDLVQADGRGAREAFHGSREPTLVGGSAVLLELSRAGRPNPAHAARAPSERVGYALEGRALVRYAWPAPDRAPGVEPRRRVLLEGVTAVEVAFLSAGQWRADWPAPGVTPQQAGRPRAVRVALVLADLGRLERVVETIGDGP